MKKNLTLLAVIMVITVNLRAQVEPLAGKWSTWFISSGKDYRLPAPAANKNEIPEILSAQQNIDAAMMQQITYWNAGSPGYHWNEMIMKLYMTDFSANGKGVLAYMLLSAATHDATIAAWESKYAYNRPRPFEVDKRIKMLSIKPGSPSYPCEHSVAAGVAVTVISHFFPKMADSANRLAQQQMKSRIAAGISFPSDTRAGFELGKRIALEEIEKTKDFATKETWDNKIPTQAGLWNGKNPMYPVAGKNKTVVLTSASQFRPGPPPDFAKEMDELRNFKQTFRSLGNAFYWATGNYWHDVLDKKIFEQNLHMNPPRAARLYAITAIGLYDAFVACWDAKYAYWGIRPDQYDTTFRPALLITPPFPGYPSGHATVSGLMGELHSYFFPADSATFRQKARDGAESRFQAGIHFRSDNEVGLDMGRKIAMVIIQKVKNDVADTNKKSF